MAATAKTDQSNIGAVMSDTFGTAAGAGMRSRRAAPRAAASQPPVPTPSAPVKLLAGMTEPRRHRGMAARRSADDTARPKPKPYSLLMPPDMSDWVGDFAHYGRVDRSEMHRELVHILMDCQDGLITELPAGEAFVDFLLDRIMERRRVANSASAGQVEPQ